MTTVVVSLVAFAVLVAAIAALVGWRQRNRLSSDADSAGARQAVADQHRHEADRHFASRMSASDHMPNGM
ncbi:hypothetical protein [Micromonospora musae]|uniref:Uncharacterized protein n=1 Tax=Micromonospora musae TaxID=1894970 RepID=A0A3A9Y4K5_9ACTN|nr:hypothetical protein [Micromonospora musae]RKN32401.1 hypothetical protein D7044_14270 [Micromonospora musae]